MCYNCGCFSPYDNMGNSDNISEATFKHLAEHLSKSLEETKRHVLKILEKEQTSGFEKIEEEKPVQEMFDKASLAWGQTPKQARKNTLDLLLARLKDA